MQTLRWGHVTATCVTGTSILCMARIYNSSSLQVHSASDCDIYSMRHLCYIPKVTKVSQMIQTDDYYGNKSTQSPKTHRKTTPIDRNQDIAYIDHENGSHAGGMIAAAHDARSHRPLSKGGRLPLHGFWDSYHALWRLPRHPRPPSLFRRPAFATWPFHQVVEIACP